MQKLTAIINTDIIKKYIKS